AAHRFGSRRRIYLSEGQRGSAPLKSPVVTTLRNLRWSRRFEVLVHYDASKSPFVTTLCIPRWSRRFEISVLHDALHSPLVTKRGLGLPFVRTRAHSGGRA